MEQFDKNQLEKTDQQLFTDSFNFCWELLKSKDYYLCERETNIFSRLSLNYGQDMYDAMKIIMNKIIKSNERKVVVEKSKVGSIKIVTKEATRDTGYDDNYDQLDQQQKQKQVDEVKIDIENSQDKMISKKRKKPVDEIHSKKILKKDIKKNNFDDSSNAKNIQTPSLNEKESVTIEDEILSITDDLINYDKINNSSDNSIGLEKKSNEISNSFSNNNQSCSNKVIENVDPKKNTRIRTGSLASKKYRVYTAEEDDELSSTPDKNDLNDDDFDVIDDDIDVDDDDDNSLNQHKNLEGKIKITSEISFEEKTRVVKLASENPSWSLDMLKEQSGCKNIKCRSQVEVWKKQIERGGTLRRKMNLVNNWVINKCIEKQKKGKIITNEKIQTWGLEAKKIFKPVKFSAAKSWLTVFKKNYEITGKADDLTINCNMQKKKSLSLSTTYVPYKIKLKVVNLAYENPHWSLDMLREQSGVNLENITQLRYWKQTVRDFNKKKATNFSTGSTASKEFNSIGKI